MEPPLNNYVHGPPKPTANAVPEGEKPAWKVPIGPRTYHGSADASLFSTSLPVLSHGKLDFNESVKGVRLLDDEFPSLDKLKLIGEVKDSFEEKDRSIIGNLLPSDEDELFANGMDDFDLTGLPTQLEDLDDDFFGSGFDIDPDNAVGTLSHYGFENGIGAVSGEHPHGELPSRTLFVRNINSNVDDSELKSLFEHFGDIRTLYTACKHRGFVMISYYDIRDAQTAMHALQNKPLRRRKLDIHFSIPKDNPSDKDINQGTLVVFNLDPSVSNDDLIKIFGTYGEVKEIREPPHKQNHKFIEFYDVRAAEAALNALNRSNIGGKCINLEPSHSRQSINQQLSHDQEQDQTRVLRHSVSSPIANSPPGSWPTTFRSPVNQFSSHGYNQSTDLRGFSPVVSNNLAGLSSSLQASTPLKNSPIGNDHPRNSYFNAVVPIVNAAHGSAYQQRVTLPDTKLSSSPAPVSSHEFLWGSPATNSEKIGTSPWPSSVKGRPFPSGHQGIRFPLTDHHNSMLGSSHHHLVGSAPSGIPFQGHFGFFPEPPETSYMNQASYGFPNLCRGVNMGNAFPGNFSEIGPPGARMMPMPRNMPMYYGNGSFFGMGATINDGIFDRYQRIDTGNHMDIKKQYQLDLEKIANGEDTRTTLMIKNIPNKYTSKMLLAAIDETHSNTYDFLYLPIDFKNKCNVGYAFINMVSPRHIITFHEAFNGKKWEKFNSEKVASLAYARIQGKTALVSHFQNSSLMNEDKRCRPILFRSKGQETSDLETFPSGSLNIFTRQPDGSYTGDSFDYPKDG